MKGKKTSKRTKSNTYWPGKETKPIYPKKRQEKIAICCKKIQYNLFMYAKEQYMVEDIYNEIKFKSNS